MYGGSGKMGRGGGGGSGGRGGGGPVKRNIHSSFQQPSLQRPSTVPGGRLSSGGAAGPRNRSTTPVPPPPALSSAAEETFSLVRSNPLNFAMIIRLAPDLVDEIKRLEAQGGAARIKFDANQYHPSENVIDVGGKLFRFTWSRELGDLCDIYEERRSGDDGDGLLVESGSAWRKVNVQRVLDESTKNHVKMRSEEAERKLKARKAIVLDHGNSLMKNQMKALAAAEVNPWRMSYKQKKEPPFKKKKAEPPSVGGPPKSTYKSASSLTTPSKVRASASPLLSPPEQSVAPLSPFGTNSLTKAHASTEDATLTQATSKEKASISGRELPSRVFTGAVQDKPGRKGKLGAKPTDLRSLLVSLLMEKPQGTYIKALEKAIGDAIPKSVKQIEPILKEIAVFQAPGKYVLKPELDLESFKKPSFESGSSPEDNQSLAPAPEASSSLKADMKEMEDREQLTSKPIEELNASEKMDIERQSPADIFGEKKVSDNSEGPAGSSSVSGSESDSESDSSDSGSDSGSPSRSPIGSGSGSSSDSGSDASSNSKEGSDEDVDIMSDDDKESKHKLQYSGPGLSTSAIPWKTPEEGPVNNVEEKQDGHGSDVVEIEKELPEDDLEVITVHTNSFPDKGGEKPAEETKFSSPDNHEYEDSDVYTGRWSSERENAGKDGFKNEQSNSSKRISTSKSKRGSDGNHFDEFAERKKKLKLGNMTRPQFSGGRNSRFSASPLGVSPDRPVEGPYQGPSTHATSRTARDVTDYGFNKGYNQEVPGKSISDSPRSGRKSIDLNAQAKTAAAVERPDKYAEGLGLGGSGKYSERILQTHDGLSTQKDKVSRETQEDDNSAKDKRPPKNSRLGAVGDKHSDSQSRKHGALGGKFKEAGSISNLQTRNSPMDNYRTDLEKSPVINGRGILQRELSDLELGELRENLHEETSGAKKQFEKNNSFKQSDNKSSSEYWNLDLSKGKSGGRTSVDSAKASPPNLNVGLSSNLEGLSKKRTPEYYVEGLSRPQQKGIQPLTQQLSRVHHAEVGSQHNKLAELSSRGRHNEAKPGQGPNLEEYGDTLRKVPANAPKQHGSKQGVLPLSTKESKKQEDSLISDIGEKRKDTSLSECNDGGRKRRESSSDESSSYYKYEKEEPELKGPIKDANQYEEYVQEFREKYHSYRSIDKILESYRNDFRKLGSDLELAKGSDDNRYYKLLAKIMDSYSQCAARHKRLKKIFVVLHEELQHLKQMIGDFADSYIKD